MLTTPRFGEHQYGQVLYDNGAATPVCNRRKGNTIYPLLTRTVPDELVLTRQMNERLGAIEQTNQQMLTTLQEGFAQLTQAMQQRFPQL